MPAVAVHPAESDIEWLSRDSCASYCERLRNDLKKDEEALELARDELLRTQKDFSVQGLCKLTKDVKKLSVDEFNSTYGCDLVDLIRKQMEAGGILGSSGGKKRFRAGFAGSQQVATGNGGLSLKTPAAYRLGKPPMTRTARRGEVVKSYSVNGSPVDPYDHGEVVVTAKKRRGVKDASVADGGNAAPFPISIGIGAGNGATIDLSDPNQRKNLDGEQKAQAMQQLMAIQDQMNKLMADF
eukprot:CAMPEP_0172529044 /NCGR_PEP_ID=MMETSP1067-20121228/3225_1 /TAXON_ID=265564 ORGANISM="Thalassiosira punctigera, Strain Tpunct2005C2" /NCGR_SAMPLE_ID=MMETSP1067 /ASSEMBLY_ACC=CAM_ASM_000444 /LENGTH=239 /DNA_ID=CAMNT_0013313033 /DNA_START=103 /DNA_END=822 /DNA_ORIENTATION=+